MKLTAQTDVVNLNSTTLKSGSLTTILGGTANAVSSLTSGNAGSGTFTVPIGQSLTAVISGGAAGPFSLTYGAGTTFAGSDVTSPNSASRKLDGAVSAGASGATAPLNLATPLALTGTLSSVGQFSASSRRPPASSTPSGGFRPASAAASASWRHEQSIHERIRCRRR